MTAGQKGARGAANARSGVRGGGAGAATGPPRWGGGERGMGNPRTWAESHAMRPVDWFHFTLVWWVSRGGEEVCAGHPLHGRAGCRTATAGPPGSRAQGRARPCGGGVSPGVAAGAPWRGAAGAHRGARHRGVGRGSGRKRPGRAATAPPGVGRGCPRRALPAHFLRGVAATTGVAPVGARPVARGLGGVSPPRGVYAAKGRPYGRGSLRNPFFLFLNLRPSFFFFFFVPTASRA